MADIQVLEKLIAGQEKQTRASRDALEQQKLDILNSIKKELDEGKLLGKYDIGDERLKSWFQTLPLLAIKPILYVYNVSYGKGTGDRAEGIEIDAKLESELAALTDDEQKELLNKERENTIL